MEEESKTGLKIPVWDCKPTSFAQWGKKIGRYLMSKELAWVLRREHTQMHIYTHICRREADEEPASTLQDRRRDHTGRPLARGSG